MHAQDFSCQLNQTYRFCLLSILLSILLFSHVDILKQTVCKRLFKQYLDYGKQRNNENIYGTYLRHCQRYALNRGKRQRREKNEDMIERWDDNRKQKGEQTADRRNEKREYHDNGKVKNKCQGRNGNDIGKEGDER